MEAVGDNGFGRVIQFSGLGARWVPRWVATRRPESSSGRPPGADAEVAERLQSPAGTREQCGAPGRSRRGPGGKPEVVLLAIRRTKGAVGRGPGARPRRRWGGNFARGRGGGARPGGASRRNAPHNSRAERGKAGRPAPAPPGPVRVRLHTWWFSFLPPAAAAGPPGPLVMFTYRERVSGLRRVHILRASHTDARLRHSQPASSLIGGLRPLAPITAGARRRTRRRLQPLPPPPPRLEPSRPTRRPSSPFRAEAGGGEERAALNLPAYPVLSAPGTPPPRKAVSTRSTNATPAARSLQSAFPRPKEPAGREVGQRERASAWRASPPPVWLRLLTMA